jgi:hypothetical protein
MLVRQRQEVQEVPRRLSRRDSPLSEVAAATRMAGAMADEIQIPLDERLEEIGAQLDWVRGYL